MPLPAAGGAGGAPAPGALGAPPLAAGEPLFGGGVPARPAGGGGGGAALPAGELVLTPAGATLPAAPLDGKLPGGVETLPVDADLPASALLPANDGAAFERVVSVPAPHAENAIAMTTDSIDRRGMNIALIPSLRIRRSLWT